MHSPMHHRVGYALLMHFDDMRLASPWLGLLPYPTTRHRAELTCAAVRIRPNGMRYGVRSWCILMLRYSPAVALAVRGSPSALLYKSHLVRSC